MYMLYISLCLIVYISYKLCDNSMHVSYFLYDIYFYDCERYEPSAIPSSKP